ncbi:MAG TPA: response regulator [Polyangiaceae bacterium]|nr:response regulator [Polyangiaceae bacterium]
MGEQHVTESESAHGSADSLEQTGPCAKPAPEAQTDRHQAVQSTMVCAVCLAMHAPTVAPRVLLVEDERVLARVYSRALVASGFLVDIASDGAEGFERLLAGSYDVVVSDVCMPRMNGLDLLEQVRRLRPNVPVVLITAQLDEQAYEQARGLGAARYLLKPVTMDQLARAVQGAARLRAALVRTKKRRP